MRKSWPCHFALAVGDDGAESLAEFLDDDGGTQTRRSFDGGNRAAGAGRCEQFEAQRAAGRARGGRQLLGVVDELVHAQGLDVFQHFGQAKDQGDRRGPGGFALGRIFLFAPQVEVVARQLGGFHALPGLGTDGEKRQARAAA